MQDRRSVIGGVRMQPRQSMDEQPIHMNANRIKYNVITVIKQCLSNGKEDNGSTKCVALSDNHCLVALCKGRDNK